jgi:hypothetical protein
VRMGLRGGGAPWPGIRRGSPAPAWFCRARHPTLDTWCPSPRLRASCSCCRSITRMMLGGCSLRRYRQRAGP